MNQDQIVCASLGGYPPFDDFAITDVGTRTATYTRRHAVELIRSFGWNFYTLDSLGNRAEVRVIDHRNGWTGEPYLTTSPDGSKANNLLHLGACSLPASR